jgi:putative Holliday junction resolvase
MKYLAIDYGLRRVGLATCDEAEFFASPYATREIGEGKKSAQRLLREIVETVQTLGIEGIVIGLPRAASGEVSEMETATRNFCEQLENAMKHAGLEVSIEWWDERFSTAQVWSGLRAAGVSTRQAKAAIGDSSIDARAAAIILQDFLDAKKLRSEPEAYARELSHIAPSLTLRVRKHYEQKITRRSWRPGGFDNRRSTLAA